MNEQKKWSKEEIEKIKKAVYDGCDVLEIAEMLGRTEASIRAKANRLGLNFNDFKCKREKTKFFDYQVRCPFFKSLSQSQMHICCEGADENSRLIVVFKCGNSWALKMNRHCCDEWQRCLIAKMLEGKY